METLRYVLLANGLLCLVSIAFYVLLRRETFFEANRIALWLGLLSALILPLVQLPDWRPQPVRKVMQKTAQVIIPTVLPDRPPTQPEVTITFPNGHTYRALTTQDTSFTWSWQVGLVAIYLFGTLCLFVRFGFRLRSLVQLIRQAKHEIYEDFTLVRSEQTTSPFSFFNWVVLNPDQHAPDELEQILRHERVHVRSWHSVDMLCTELVCVVFWFNPAAYLFRYLLQQTLEYSADRIVLAEGIDSRTYQYNLVKVSLLTQQPVFTNQFSGPTLHQRIAMINKQRSNVLDYGRYVFWFMLMGVMMMACQHIQSEEDKPATKTTFPFPITNATRALAAQLDQPNMPWFRQATLEINNPPIVDILNGKKVIRYSGISYPRILCLRNNHLAFKLQPGEQVKLFINGQAKPDQALSSLTFEEIGDLFLYQKWEDAKEADQFPETYRLFISTTHKTPETDQAKYLLRSKWKQYMQAMAVSDYPLGTSHFFSMNQVLEATFFSNKQAFVKRTKDDHLMLYDDYATDIDIYINGIPARPKNLEGVHVREVDKLYTGERSFEKWTTDNPERKPRFVLYLQTAPKRAKRDSSYYVFSPFYSGDF
ncbi:M56 family metallopeptidase [Spirosoma sp. RP8]|uniref:M56 family metallopeptidase n=1 Tax=Spirosoma liriopis TaxID=2937440 RepID=A0ABT0HI64_9BACT|nr:M56 family metallopeptidase [Spirosoma liriopis]MCK8491844.1 M56 family metallopeptidase [Spirosoma liriopis]